jgi:hypothetical protein
MFVHSCSDKTVKVNKSKGSQTQSAFSVYSCFLKKCVYCVYMNSHTCVTSIACEVGYKNILHGETDDEVLYQ